MPKPVYALVGGDSFLQLEQLAAISRELGLPVRFVGVGEKAGDLLPFSPKDFVDSLFA